MSNDPQTVQGVDFDDDYEDEELPKSSGYRLSKEGEYRPASLNPVADFSFDAEDFGSDDYSGDSHA